MSYYDPNNPQGTTINTVPPPSVPPMAPQDRDAMIRTIAGEAGNQGAAGQAAVAHVIMNRVNSNNYPNTPSGVVMQPGEFSMWNGVTGFARGQGANKIGSSISPNDPTYSSIGNVVDGVYNGAIPDPTGGATNYYTNKGPGRISQPKWAPALAAVNSTQVGDQVFVGRGGPGAPGASKTEIPGTTLYSTRPPMSNLITGGDDMSMSNV
jgi:spore germination cell wall hydrolase CwlJ-like protein